MADTSDFLTMIEEIRGTGAVDVAPVDGIYWDLTIAPTGENDAPGKYGHMREMYTELAGPTGSYNDFVVKYVEFIGKYADVLVHAGVLATSAAIAEEAMNSAVSASNATAVTAEAIAADKAAIDSRLDAVQANGNTVEYNLNSVADNAIDIGTVAALKEQLTAVIALTTSMEEVNANSINTDAVASISADVQAVADGLLDVRKVSTAINAISRVAAVDTEVTRLAVEPAFSRMMEAEDNSYKAEIESWHAEARKRTAESYAMEGVGIPVKLWSSVGDGTYTYVETLDYSSKHFSYVATGGLRSFLGYFPATNNEMPADGDVGEYWIVSEPGDVDGTVSPALVERDELRWEEGGNEWAIYRNVTPFSRLYDVPENVSNAQSKSERGVADGYVPLNSDALISAQYLPSYVDDAVEVATKVDLPAEGEEGKIYVVVADEGNGDDTSTYRWTGSAYALIHDTMSAADIKSLYENNADTNVYTDADTDKVGYISVTQDVDLDTIESDTASNNAKETNVTTDITISTTAAVVTVESSDGTNGDIAAANSDNAGIMSKDMFNKLNAIDVVVEW